MKFLQRLFQKLKTKIRKKLEKDKEVKELEEYGYEHYPFLGDSKQQKRNNK